MAYRPERVAITGLGLITPLGIGVETNWQSAISGKSGIRKITHFDASDMPTDFAGEVPDFDAEQYLDKKQVKHYDRFTHFSIAAADMALSDAGLEPDDLPKERTGILVGSGMGGMEKFVENAVTLEQKGYRRVSPFFIPAIISNMAPGLLSIRYGTRGANFSISSACATGAHAIGEALHMIQRGDSDVMIAGGSEAAVIPLGIAGFIASRALSSYQGDPTEASRPFDKARDGFVMGEGAGIVILESESHAKARNARIYAYLSSAGYSSDAYHPTAPCVDGSGAALAMKNALRNAGLEPKDIGYINAHGTSTSLGDKAEVVAMQRVFHETNENVFLSSTKSMTGHLLGAAGAVEAGFTALALFHGELPPTINLTDPDPDCAMNHVANESKKVQVEHALSNAFGFGSTNSSLILSRA